MSPSLRDVEHLMFLDPTVYSCTDADLDMKILKNIGICFIIIINIQNIIKCNVVDI
jgi:MinD superfamily P-loop ATPase